MNLLVIIVFALLLSFLPSRTNHAHAKQYWDCEIFVEGVGVFSGYGLTEDEAYDDALNHCYEAGLPTHPNICFNSRFQCY